MTYLVHDLKNGAFELIDEVFIELYDISADDLYKLSDDDYKQYQRQHNHLTTFENGEFVYRDIEIDMAELKAKTQEQIWELIKQKRHDNTRGGTFIKSVGKWFHTDDSSRTQYLALQLLPQLPSDLAWKCMDNQFVPMTKELLTEIAMTILAEEQADFANAEKHRMLMLQSDDPLNYDYSTGWSATYDSQTYNLTVRP